MGTHGATAQGGSQGLDYRVDLSVQGVDHRAAGVACVPARLCVCVFLMEESHRSPHFIHCVLCEHAWKETRLAPPLLLGKQPAGVKGEAKKHKERDT